MGFSIVTEHVFSAAHQVQLPDGVLEPLHGHNWVLRVTVRSERLDEFGMVMDFHALQREVERVIAPFRSRNLNEIPPFDRSSPTAERIAAFVARSLELPRDVTLARVELTEAPGCQAVCEP